MSQSNDVIKYLRRKSSSGTFEPISWIGAEQRFVSALRNSGVNNLEEQYIIGTETYTVEYQDENQNDIIEKNGKKAIIYFYLRRKGGRQA